MTITIIPDGENNNNTIDDKYLRFYWQTVYEDFKWERKSCRCIGDLMCLKIKSSYINWINYIYRSTVRKYNYHVL